jgi:hypothetical protein
MGSDDTQQHMTGTKEKEGKQNQREQKGGGGSSACSDQDRKKGKRRRGERMRWATRRDLTIPAMISLTQR